MSFLGGIEMQAGLGSGRIQRCSTSCRGVEINFLEVTKLESATVKF